MENEKKTKARQETQKSIEAKERIIKKQEEHKALIAEKQDRALEVMPEPLNELLVEQSQRTYIQKRKERAKFENDKLNELNFINQLK